MSKKSFAVIGLSLFGRSLAKTLYELGQEVIAVDGAFEKVDNIKDFVTHAKQADITSSDALKEAGVANCDVAIVARSDEKSILTTIILKELGVNTVIAKSRDEMHGLALHKVGASKVIFPEKEFGARLANQLISSDILEHIELSKDYWIKEIEVPKLFFGKTLKDIDAVEKYGVIILSLKRGFDIMILPSANERIQDGDLIVILGRTKDVEKFANLSSSIFKKK
jgi:trk system potassium uptake protein TrkA